jgi:histidinol phosphatase-like enzyme
LSKEVAVEYRDLARRDLRFACGPTPAGGDVAQCASPINLVATSLILRARDDFALDLPHSVLVGDKDSDIEAGGAAGVGYNVKLVKQSEVGSSPDRLEFHTLHAIGVWLGRTFGSMGPG